MWSFKSIFDHKVSTDPHDPLLVENCVKRQGMLAQYFDGYRDFRFYPGINVPTCECDVSIFEAIFIVSFCIPHLKKRYKSLGRGCIFNGIKLM